MGGKIEFFSNQFREVVESNSVRIVFTGNSVSVDPMVRLEIISLLVLLSTSTGLTARKTRIQLEVLSMSRGRNHPGLAVSSELLPRHAGPSSGSAKARRREKNRSFLPPGLR